ncbi:MAG: serine/threonine-protein kinase [Candidatus Melainabacteria bacterium]|nr:serine/threonine-protein kinase [Candidatus Melainabacteria bacterium]
MARKSEIKFHHYREIAAMATWWKAIFLTPIWAFMLIMPFGAFVRFYMPDMLGVSFLFVVLLGLLYFCRDLNRRFVTVTDKDVYFGMGSYKLSSLKRIKIGYVFKFFNISPSQLALDFEEEEGKIRRLDLDLASISGEDSEALVDLLSRKVSQLKIDDDVERTLISGKSLVVTPPHDPDHIEIKYHGMRLAEELPAVLDHTIFEWSRIVGPIGTLLLSTPVWLWYNWTLMNALRDYTQYEPNKQFYDELIQVLGVVNVAASTGVSAFQQFIELIINSPFVTIGLVLLFVYGFFNLFIAGLLSPNKMTITPEELSLDMWQNLWSYNATTVKWNEVENVSLRAPGESADPNQWEVVFTGKENKSLANLPLSSVSVEDRPKLAAAIERFAPKSSVEAQLTEALRPRQDKSYTELWLQSLNSSSLVNLDPLEEGHLLKGGSYEIINTLAIGGEGVAYLAHDLRQVSSGLVSDVVLKETLIPAYVDKEIQQQCIERFEREARLLKELQSEHIVELNQYFIEDKRCYLVLEYIKGQNLRQLVAERGALEPELVLELAQQMTDILAFLHSKQIIHRDFTPDNLIMQANGKLKLIDFNVASECKDDGKTGTIVGKHAYVPPEQFRGKPCEASDIYALGATLFYLATGEDPEPISQSSLTKADIGTDKNNQSLKKLDLIIKACTSMSLKTRLANTYELNNALSDDGDKNSQPVAEIDAETVMEEVAKEETGGRISTAKNGLESVAIKKTNSEKKTKQAAEQPWQT